MCLYFSVPQILPPPRNFGNQQHCERSASFLPYSQRRHSVRVKQLPVTTAAYVLCQFTNGSSDENFTKKSSKEA
ncbi:hypothetical protein Q5P01_002688 [Channa striata]|uniref:Uncharacterized protein n=1 Tax=Channa striata TaxID=64152 RepID=A0AA88NPN3_CHASR|nr:hypothetical protein Q5P01_002688 [Channa striata]